MKNENKIIIKCHEQGKQIEIEQKEKGNGKKTNIRR